MPARRTSSLAGGCSSQHASRFLRPDVFYRDMSGSLAKVPAKKYGGQAADFFSGDDGKMIVERKLLIYSAPKTHQPAMQSGGSASGGNHS
jgi:hypothetical protein